MRRTMSAAAVVCGLCAILVIGSALRSAAEATVYFSNFETGDLSGWSTVSADGVYTNPITTDVTPAGGRRFLGQFGPQPVWLSLAGLPAHSSMTIEFDLFLINSWDGNADYNDPGPDIWGLAIEGGESLLSATFSTTEDRNTQTYPSPFYGIGDPQNATNQWDTGAVEVETLGYTHFGDAVYHIKYVVAHASPTVALRFWADGLQELTDESWGLDNVSVTVNAVADTTPPSLTPLTPSTAMLWPPNHKMVDVYLDYAATDNADAPEDLAISVTVASSEPENGLGDGDTAADWEVVGPHHVRLRAERAGGGSGRVYTVTVTCTDKAGNETSQTAEVVVPKSRGK